MSDRYQWRLSERLGQVSWQDIIPEAENNQLQEAGVYEYCVELSGICLFPAFIEDFAVRGSPWLLTTRNCHAPEAPSITLSQYFTQYRAAKLLASQFLVT